MKGHAVERVRAPASRGPSDLMAGAGFVLMAVSAVAIATLLFVRHDHTVPGAHGYWTDILGFRAGVDNVGIGTAVTIFANGDLHWQHNALQFGALLVGLTGFALSHHGWRRASRSPDPGTSRASSSA